MISTAVAMITVHCAMGRYAERMRLFFNDFCRDFRGAAEKETVIHFFSLCAHPLLDAGIDCLPLRFKDIALFMKLSG